MKNPFSGNPLKRAANAILGAAGDIATGGFSWITREASKGMAQPLFPSAPPAPEAPSAAAPSADKTEEGKLPEGPTARYSADAVARTASAIDLLGDSDEAPRRRGASRALLG